MPRNYPLGVVFRIAETLKVEARELLTRHADDADDDAWPATHELDCSPLDHTTAKLLRRIARGEDIRRTMSRPQREFTLPAMIRRGLVEVTGTGVTVAPIVQTDASEALGTNGGHTSTTDHAASSHSAVTSRSS